MKTYHLISKSGNEIVNRFTCWLVSKLAQHDVKCTVILSPYKVTEYSLRWRFLFVISDDIILKIRAGG